MMNELSVFGKLFFKDLMKMAGKPKSPRIHFNTAVQWLTRAHDMTPDDGVSYGYSLKGGWRQSYIETS